ncbi:hypothetical protein [Paenibacillus sinopodophylli]|uniref:hypothetical protein n=1 Tax=Paenibacillus sinopodophylli TaxID=1837342 RepID=UPI00110C97F6|nr:hypothetical protein [Paenibacillus sinopodophylli]
MKTPQQAKQNRSSCLLRLILMLGIPAFLFIAIIAYAAGSIIGELGLFDKKTKVTRTIIVNSHDTFGLYGYTRTDIKGVYTDGQQKLKEIHLKSDESEELFPLYTYQITYTGSHRKGTIESARRWGTYFHKKEFELWEADISHRNSPYFNNILPRKKTLGINDTSHYRWNGLELEISRSFLRDRYGQKDQQGFVLEVEGVPKYYFVCQFLQSEPVDPNIITFDLGTDPFDNNMNPDYVVIYSEHPGMKLLTENKWMVYDTVYD